MERRAKIKKILKDNWLFFGILAGVILGCLIGVLSHDAIRSSADPSPKRLAMYVKFPGELFIRMLKMIVIPLLTSSIIVALTDLTISSAGRLGKITVVYYLTTTIVSAILGLVLATIIKPGSGVYDDESQSTSEKEQVHNTQTVDSILDLLRNAFPDNVIEALISSTYTRYQKTTTNYRFEWRNTSYVNMSAEAVASFVKDNVLVPRSSSENQQLVVAFDKTYDFGGTSKTGGMNTIGLIVFSIAFGVVLNLIKDEGKPLVGVFNSLWNATMKLVEIIMWLAPVGICSVVAGSIVDTDDIALLVRALGLFVLANLVGHAIQAFVFYPLLYLGLVRRNPVNHVKNMLPAFVTALGTSSSSATLPTTIECCESKAKINKDITRFVLPIGATCNMDGAALYYGLVVLFVEQMEPTVSLNVGDKILAILMATLISIGAAGIPSPGLTNTIIVLQAIGLPVDKIGPIFAVDWLLDRVGTCISVMGDTYAAAIVEKFSPQIPKVENKQDFENATIRCQEKTMLTVNAAAVDQEFEDAAF